MRKRILSREMIDTRVSILASGKPRDASSRRIEISVRINIHHLPRAPRVFGAKSKRLPDPRSKPVPFAIPRSSWHGDAARRDATRRDAT